MVSTQELLDYKATDESWKVFHNAVHLALGSLVAKTCASSKDNINWPCKVQSIEMWRKKYLDKFNGNLHSSCAHLSPLS